MTAVSSQMAKSRTLIYLVFFCPCCDRIFVVLVPFEAVTRHGPSNRTDKWTKRSHRWVVARAYQSVCASAHTKVGALQGNFPTTHLRLHTNTTALGRPVQKTAVRLPYHACLCCKRGITILSALRACESWSIANLGRVKKQYFPSAKQY